MKQSHAPERRVDLQVFGAMRVTLDDDTHPRVSQGLQHLISVLVAAGPAGISKDGIAEELWGDDPVPSWKSLLRNRITQLRKLLGPACVVNLSSLYQLSSSVRVDSWQLLALPADSDVVSDGPLPFLQGEPFDGIQRGPLLDAHAQLVQAHRAARIQSLVSQAGEPLGPLTLQALREYQERHVLDATITQQTVVAHLRAGNAVVAADIIDRTRVQAAEAAVSARWIDELDDLEADPTIERQADQALATPSAAVVAEAEQTHFRMRADIFASAAESDDWNMAFEIAMNGLPEAEKMNGDPERLRLLARIPMDVLDPKQKFTLASTLAQHYLLVHQNELACQWSQESRRHVQSLDDELTAFLVGVTVGDAFDERVALELPKAFDQGTDLVKNMRVLQAATVSHLERSPADHAAGMVDRLVKLAKVCTDPYRRWHTLLLKATLKFVAGEWDEAQAASNYAVKYGELCGAADAPGALRGQRLNPAWVHPSFIPQELPVTAATTPIDLGLFAALTSDPSAADAYLDNFDCESSAYFVVAVLVPLASRLRSPINRRRVRSRLLRRSGTSVFLGSGAMHFGPVDRALAALSDDPEEVDHWSASAIEVADRQQTRIWQVACRLERAALTKNESLIAEAQELATTPFLQKVVAVSTR